MAKRRNLDRVRESGPAYSTAPHVLIDSSVWIEYLRRTSARPDHLVKELIAARRARLCGVVEAELIQGARDDRELLMIDELIGAVPAFYEPAALWLRTGHLSRNLRRKGISPGLSDCFLAVLAQAHGARILTRDRDFELIGAELKISVEIL